MALEQRRPGTAGVKRNCWIRGKGAYSYRGELKRGISLNRKRLNRKVRHQTKVSIKDCGYRKICRTANMVDFT